jgi:hypothetical protein
LVKCQKCGTQSPAGTNFCGGCGSKLGWSYAMPTRKKKPRHILVIPHKLPSRLKIDLIKGFRGRNSAYE